MGVPRIPQIETLTATEPSFFVVIQCDTKISPQINPRHEVSVLSAFLARAKELDESLKPNKIVKRNRYIDFENCQK